MSCRTPAWCSSSETDTEVLPHLIARAYQGDLVEAVRAVIPKIAGHYAFVVAHSAEPGRLVGTRYECPLVVGVGDDESFLASAIPAFLHETREIMNIDDGEIVVLDADGAHVLAADGVRGATPGRARRVG